MARQKRQLDVKTGAPRPLDLRALPLGQGMRFGTWSLWRDEPRRASFVCLFLIDAASQCVIYLPTGSNGWVNYRLPSCDADDWYVIWSSGQVETQRRGLQQGPYVARSARHELREDAYRSDDWTFRVRGEQLRIDYLAERRLTLWRSSPKWTCDEVELPGI